MDNMQPFKIPDKNCKMCNFKFQIIFKISVNSWKYLKFSKILANIKN